MFKILPFTLLLMAPMAITAKANIVLTIDAGSKTWSLSGNDSGNVFWNSDLARVTWDINDLSGGAAGTNSSIQSPAANVAGWTPSEGNLAAFTSVSSATRSFSLSFFQSSTTDINGLAATIAAITQPNSYASFASADQAWIESLRGGTIPVSAGSNFDPIQVIPEPSCLTVVGTCSLFIATRRRRTFLKRD